jgi:hypothetical protein
MTPRATRMVGVLTAAWLGLVPVRTAHAQSDVCDGQLHEGVDLRRQGRDAEALERFRQAWETCRRPRARVQIAWASQAVGRWVDAAANLREALATRDDPWLEARRAQLEDDLRTVEGHVGSLEVIGGAPGAEVRLDGTLVATLPTQGPFQWAVGEVRLEVRLPGDRTVTRSITITPGRVTREQVEVSVDRPVATVALSNDPPYPEARPTVLPGPRRGGLRHVLAVGAGVGAGVLLAGAAVAYGYGYSLVDSHNGNAGCPGVGASEQPGPCETWLQTSYTMETLSLVGLGAGVALGATAVVLLFTERRGGADPAPRAAIGCGGGPGTIGVACGLRF